MELLSIGASVVGLLIATAQVSKLLTKFIHSGKNAPSLAKHVLREVSDIDAVITQLRGFLDGSRSGSQSRKKLVMMDQVLVTLTTCVMTFSELQSILESLDLDQPTQAGSRIGLVWEESSIKESLERLQWSKASLNLMLTTLTCASMDEATESVTTLTREVHQILQSNQELSSRLRNLEDTSNSRNLPSSSSLFRQHDHEDDASTIVPKRPVSAQHETTDEIPPPRFAFDFDKDLYDSWVYSRTLRQNRPQSLSSSAPNSFAWSCLSDLSLADISNISLKSLPITGDDLKNSKLYGFKKQIVEPTATLWHGQLNLTGPTIRHKRTLVVNVSLLGVQSSGKTTIRHQMQILYGHGFQEAERITYRTIIEKFWKDACLAVNTVEDDQSNRRAVISNALPSVKEAQSDLSHFGFCHQIGRGISGFQSCPRCCRNLATDPRMPGHLLTMGNVEYFATRLDEISADGYVPSNSDILHASISSTGQSSSFFEIDSIRHRVTDTKDLFPPPITSMRMSKVLAQSDYVIYSASLIDYRPSAVNHRKPMSKSMYVFENLCKSIEAPIVLLLTKLDILYDTIGEYPICNYYRDASRDMTCRQACDFFADRFQARDRRPNGQLHIYFVNATDTDDIEWVMRDIREHVSTSAPQSSGSLAAQNLRVDRRQSFTDIISSLRKMKQWELDGESSPTDISAISYPFPEWPHRAFSIQSLAKDSSEQESISRTTSKNTETEQSAGDMEVDSGGSSTGTSAASVIVESLHKAYRVHGRSQQSIAASLPVRKPVLDSYPDQSADSLKTLPNSPTNLTSDYESSHITSANSQESAEFELSPERNSSGQDDIWLDLRDTVPIGRAL